MKRAALLAVPFEGFDGTGCPPTPTGATVILLRRLGPEFESEVAAGVQMIGSLNLEQACVNVLLLDLTGNVPWLPELPLGHHADGLIMNEETTESVRQGIREGRPFTTIAHERWDAKVLAARAAATPSRLPC